MTTENQKKPTKIIIKKTQNGGGNGGGNGGKNHDPNGSGWSVLTYVLSVLIIFAVLSAAYSYVSNKTKPTPTVSLSQISTDIKAGEVTSIVVTGDDLSLVYKDGTVKSGKKESGEALSQTLVNYGLTPVQIAAAGINVKDDTGFGYWLVQLSPIIFPLLFILILKTSI